MDVNFIIDRLVAQTIAGIKSIGGSADLDAALAGAVTTPSVFIVPLTETGARSSMLSVTMQRQTAEYGVITVVANRRDVTGKASLAELTPIRAAIKAALIGWVPDTATGEAMQFTSGRLLRFDDGRVWWTDQFSFSSYYQASA